MTRLISEIPLPILAILVFISIPYSIYCFKNEERAHPGHPGRWIFIACAVFAPAFLLYRYSLEYKVGEVLSKFINIYMVISSVTLVLTFAITMFLSYKRGYMNKEKLKDLKPFLIFCLVGSIFFLVLLFILVKF